MKLFAVIRKSIFIFLLAAIIIAWAVLKSNVNVAEGVTQTVAKGYGKGLSYVSGIIPGVSLTELLFVFLLFLVIFLIVLAIRDFIKFRPIKAVCKLLDLDAAEILKAQGIGVKVLDMHTIKPLDNAAVIAAARESGAIVTIEDHTVFGGLGSAVAEVVCQNCPVPMKAS